MSFSQYNLLKIDFFRKTWDGVVNEKQSRDKVEKVKRTPSVTLYNPISGFTTFLCVKRGPILFLDNYEIVRPSVRMYPLLTLQLGQEHN